MKMCRKKLHFKPNKGYCKECKLIAYKIWESSNSEKVKLKCKIWTASNADRHKQAVKNWGLSNKEYRKSKTQEWKEANPGKANAIYAKRRAARLNATPKWLSKEQLEEIKEFYVLAKELAWLNQDGSVFHVDHIVPLQGKEVSGLHVPWNLQLLHKLDNIKKKNT